MDDFDELSSFFKGLGKREEREEEREKRGRERERRERKSNSIVFRLILE